MREAGAIVEDRVADRLVLGLVDQDVALPRPAVDIGARLVVVHRRRRRGAGRLVVKRIEWPHSCLSVFRNRFGGKPSLCIVLNVWPVPFGSVRPPQFCPMAS